MKVIKKVNHNAAVCLDNDGNELIAFGKGIGFPPVPYELEISKIDRTYYNVNPNYYSLLNEIPEEIFEIAMVLVDFYKKVIKVDLNPNLLFTLADHIHFTIQRYKKNIIFKVPFQIDVNYFYEKEMLVGKKSIHYINKKLNIHLSENEAVGIALHILNSEKSIKINHDKKDKEQIIEEITNLIEKKCNIQIKKDSFNYSRFVSHMQYLMKRSENKEMIESDNSDIFHMVKENQHETYLCVLEIKKYLDETLNWNLNDEELLYLILHVNRLCSREEYEQK